MLFRLEQRAKATGMAEHLLHTIHLVSEVVTRQAGVLSHGQKQWLEIGMLLMQEPKLLLLDEPVAGMTDEETARTAELFLTLKGKAFADGGGYYMSFIDTISQTGLPCFAMARVLAEGNAGPGAGR